MHTIDFETEAIKGAPSYRPPKPVGVSLKRGGEPSKYYSWGHPTGNNTDWSTAQAKVLQFLKQADKDEGWLAHNAAFESAVLAEYFGYRAKDPLKVHDSMFLLFLTNPYAMSFALKPSAERELGMPPDEQTDLMNWILSHVAEAKRSDWGAYISKAPAEMVAPYAEGDTDRSYLLYEKLHPRMMTMGMLEAYRREQKLSPILAESTRRGVRLDMDRLATDIEVYSDAMKIAGDYVHERLGDFNIDSDRELADALDRAGMVTDWVLTPTGKRSTARKNLVGRVKDPDLLNYMAYRGVLSTCLGTFAGPWLEQAVAEEGRLHPSWNQTRGEKGPGGDMSGTKTGRMSCIAQGERIRTKRGLVPIENIVVGDVVTSHHLQDRPVVATITNGQRLVFRYFLSNGESVVCTPDHKFWTGKDWLPMQEIANGCIETMDGSNHECTESSGPVQRLREVTSYARDSQRIGNHRAQCTGVTELVFEGGEESSEEYETLGSEVRKLEPHVREDNGEAPQLHWGLWGRAQNSSSRREETYGAQASDGGDVGDAAGYATIAFSGTPRGRESQQQRSRQLVTLHEQGTLENSQFNGRPEFGAVKVTKVQLIGVRQVFDITVEDDHSFEIAGVFAHNCKGPNLQNPPNDFENLVIPDAIGEYLAKLAAENNRVIHPVMHMRQYLLPEQGHIWLKRDFSAQEMRVMSHYAEGSLFEAFKANPKTDPHAAVMAIIKSQTGIEMKRKYVKIIGFGIMYGMGVDKLADSMGVDKDEGTKLRNAYFGALPEIRELSLDTRNRGKRGDFIRTWGGRVYYREPNLDRDLSYKLLNYLIQGSSADQTKQSIIDYDQERAPDELMLAAVHDEINVSVPLEDQEAGMVRLRIAMDKDRFDVPFASEGYAGPNWADINHYEPETV